MLLGSFSAQFTWVDWLVVVGYLALTTWIGVAMAGKQATIRDFFLGGRKLPWYAVSGSIIATEISALTFVSVPWVVFQPGGNITYLQLGIFGSFFARIIVGYWLVPEYYRREIYSPYDYMHNRLGGHVRGMTTALFTLSGMLAQAARIYLTAEVLNVVMHDQLVFLSQSTGLGELTWAIAILSGVAVIWTLLGGITTVIWTDVILFIAFALGAFVALGVVIYELPGDLGEMLRVGYGAVSSGVPWAAWGAPQPSGPWGKFTLFDWSTDPTRAYTIYTAMIASTWGGIGAYGTDQLMAQRMFCCRTAREGRIAIISSALSQLVTIAVALVGVGIFAYYQTTEPSAAAKELLAERRHGDRIFPVFIVEVVPVGLKGLIIAAIFAAAISSIMGILTALSQTVQTAFYNPLREAYLRKRGISISLAAGAEHAEGAHSDEDRRSVLVGRALVVFWGLALALVASGMHAVAARYPSLLDLGLAMAGYCGGALLAGFLLAFLRLGVDGRGFLFSAPLSVLCVFALVWHPDLATPRPGGVSALEWFFRTQWPAVVCGAGSLALLIAWGAHLGSDAVGRALPKTLILLLGIGLMFVLTYFGFWQPAPASADLPMPPPKSIAWPWQVPIGSIIAFAWGYLLARPKTRENVIT
ncbi:MAG: hypothetical protein AMXMBFR47_41720 [Planctomycetota bacterium]